MTRINYLFTGIILLSLLFACQYENKEESKREISFLTEDSVQVFADLYNLDPQAPTIILFHQARANGRSEYQTIIPELLKKGYNILAVDQRSGGQLFGSYNRTVAKQGLNRPSYCDAYPDMEAALKYISKAEFSGPVLVWGSSYSAAMVIKLAHDYPDLIDGVLAFSPASGEPMGECQPNEYFETLQTPLLVLRPESEMEYDSVKEQFALAQQFNHQIYVAKNGVHGSSMLVAERTKSNVDASWETVLAFIEDLSGK